MLVSCITPTYNRPIFLQESIQKFLQQDYPHKELIIIDDSEAPCAIEMPAQIKYIYQTPKQTIGTKRNIACEFAQGQIIVHWDDDDWYAKDWLSQQVAALQRSKAAITGLDQPFFYSPQLQQAWEYLYPRTEKAWVYGATLAYWKSTWEKTKFPAIQVGEDNQFVWAGHLLYAHDYRQGFIGRIHKDNTSPKYTAHNRWRTVPIQQLLLLNS